MRRRDEDRRKDVEERQAAERDVRQYGRRDDSFARRLDRGFAMLNQHEDQNDPDDNDDTL